MKETDVKILHIMVGNWQAASERLFVQQKIFIVLAGTAGAVPAFLYFLTKNAEKTLEKRERRKVLTQRKNGAIF